MVALGGGGHFLVNDVPLYCMKGIPSKVRMTLTWKARPESGLECLVCATCSRKVDIRLSGKREFKLPWRKAGLLISFQ